MVVTATGSLGQRGGGVGLTVPSSSVGSMKTLSMAPVPPAACSSGVASVLRLWKDLLWLNFFLAKLAGLDFASLAVR